jgi:hypothetical protein
MSIELIRRFEPILYFHKEEIFFPSDAKRYLEHCELWRAKKPFRDKTSWGKRLSAGKIAAAKGEEDLQPGDIYLGIMEGTTFPFLGTNAEEQLFLNPSGWTNAGGEHETVVTPSTKNQFAALQRLADLYGRSTPITIPVLRDSRFWYHAEVFDALRLRTIANEPHEPLPGEPSPIDLNKLLDRDQFRESTAICYYLFFPGHIEGLQGCESLETGKNFAGFAGEWACVTVLLDRDDQPKFLGLASRNANKNGEAAALGRVMDKDGRVGMVIHNWDEVNVVATSPDHVKLFVAKGTHSIYLKPGQTVLQPMTPGDPARGNCGLAEPLAATVIGSATEAESGGYIGIFLAKIAAGALVAGVLGALASLIWSLLEDKRAISGSFGTAPITIPPPTPGEPQQDFPPEDGAFGKIVHPPDFVPPDANPSNGVPWPDRETLQISGRTYSIIVDRTNNDEAIRQVWFPGSEGLKGYEGRWGPRVSPDDFDRRSGMSFPPFVNMFLHALAKELSKP